MISSAFTHWRSAFAVLLATVGMMFSSATISRAQDAAAATEAVVAAPAEEAAAPAPETPAPPTVEQTLAKLSVGIDTIWVMVCGMLVFFMNLGFGCVESGFCRSKNCVNILSKNFVVFAVCSLGYWIIGWDLMFGLGDGEFIGKSGAFMVSGADNSPIQVGSGY